VKRGLLRIGIVYIRSGKIFRGSLPQESRIGASARSGALARALLCMCISGLQSGFDDNG